MDILLLIEAEIEIMGLSQARDVRWLMRELRESRQKMDGKPHLASLAGKLELDVSRDDLEAELKENEDEEERQEIEDVMLAWDAARVG
jgi:hypothetical protein